MSATIEEIVLHQPDARNPPIDIDLNKFMGTWHVTHSTLPLWKSRKDVTITYALKTGTTGGEVKFDDTVEYRAKSDPPSATPSRVVGVDTLIAPPDSEGAPSATERPPQTRYKWRGKGLLAVATSRWQLLGCSRDLSPENAVGAWAVTYFEKTLFTPAGLDIYARTAQGLPPAVVAEIIEKVKALGGDVAKLADGFFEVERSGVDRV